MPEQHPRSVRADDETESEAERSLETAKKATVTDASSIGITDASAVAETKPSKGAVKSRGQIRSKTNSESRKPDSAHDGEEAGPTAARVPGVLAISRAQLEGTSTISAASARTPRHAIRPSLRERRSRSEGGEPFASELREMDIADWKPHRLVDEDGPEAVAMDKGEMFLMEMFPTLWVRQAHS